MKRQFPAWIRRQWAGGEAFSDVKALLSDLSLHTVCQSARCPNMGACWKRGTATLMILGHVCTRDCRYCAVATGRPDAVDAEEPGRVAEAVHRLALKHVVITSVTRDDLADGGAAHFTRTVEAIRARNPETTVEVLVPDFGGDAAAVATVLASGPTVFGHNVETVARLYPEARSARASYRRSLGVLEAAAGSSDAIIKSAFMVGHGERVEEVHETFADLRASGCEAVCIGQYLQPTKHQREVVEFITPEQFKAYEARAYELGFGFALAGPFVRSSYFAERVVALRRAESLEAEAPAQ